MELLLHQPTRNAVDRQTTRQTPGLAQNEPVPHYQGRPRRHGRRPEPALQGLFRPLSTYNGMQAPYLSNVLSRIGYLS